MIYYIWLKSDIYRATVLKTQFWLMILLKNYFYNETSITIATTTKKYRVPLKFFWLARYFLIRVYYYYIIENFLLCGIFCLMSDFKLIFFCIKPNQKIFTEKLSCEVGLMFTQFFNQWPLMHINQKYIYNKQMLETGYCFFG